MILEHAKSAADAVVKVFGAKGGAVWFDDGSGILRPAAVRGLGAAFADAFGNEMPVDQAPDLSEPLIIADFDTERPPGEEERMAVARKLGTRAVWVNRIMVEGEIIGAIAVMFDQPRAPEPNELACLDALATQVGVALSSREALERARVTEEALRVYTEVAAAMSRASDPDVILELVIENAARVVGASRARIDAVPIVREVVVNRERGTVHLPLVSFGEVLGVLEISDDQKPRDYDDVQIERLRSLADHAVVAIRNMRLYSNLAQHEAELRRLADRLVDAHEEERKRIARDLDNVVGGKLDAIRDAMVRLNGLVDGREFERARVACAVLRQEVHEVANIARNLSSELHPGILDDLGLVPAIRWYCGEVSRSSGVGVTFDAPSRVDIAREIARTVYRATQESLANVVRHAHASNANVNITQNDTGTIVLEVSDDGDGFDVTARARQGQLGIGILGIRERARHLGGRLDVRSEPGAGTRVRLEIPTD